MGIQFYYAYAIIVLCKQNMYVGTRQLTYCASLFIFLELCQQMPGIQENYYLLFII